MYNSIKNYLTSEWHKLPTNSRNLIIVQISDLDWWEAKRLEISSWFDRFCPHNKPDKQDTVIFFRNDRHFDIWLRSWSD